MVQLKIGIIGSGNSANNIVTSLSTLDSAILVAIASKDAESANRIAKQYNIPKIYDSHTDLLKDPAVDAVIISVPHNLHYALTMDALNAGKHVLCEKPLAMNMDQGREMIKKAETKDLRLGTFFQNRFMAATKEAKRIIDSGEIGLILHAQVNVLWSRDQKYYDDSPWRGKWSTEGGGSLINQASHSIDQLVWLVGKPKVVFGAWSARTHKIEVDDNAAAVVLFENEVYATIQTSTSVAPGYPAKVNVFGTKGSIQIDGNVLKVTRESGEEDVFDYDKAQVGSSNDPKKFSLAAQKALLIDFIDAVNNHRAPLVDGYEGIRAIEVITAIYRSSGKEVILL
jgi:predicted dehydrogenase